jgi:hypothetical protein
VVELVLCSVQCSVHCTEQVVGRKEGGPLQATPVLVMRADRDR